MELPAYSEREYWEQRYATGQGSEWYAAWPALWHQVCGPDSPLGEAALRPPCRVLELGCGDKPLAPGMAADGFSVVAVDFSEEAVRQASGSSGRRRGPGRVDYAAADVRALPFAGGSFGAVVDKGCFDALRSAHCAQALGEVCRVLQPGGRFVCISNAEQLLRAHARRVPGWSCVPGAPFVLAGVDDEVFLHCYRRLGHVGPAGRPAPARPERPPAAAAAAELRVATPWAERAADVRLWVQDCGQIICVGPAQALLGEERGRAEPAAGGARGLPRGAAIEHASPARAGDAVRCPADGLLQVVLPPGTGRVLAASFSTRRRELRLRLRSCSG